LYKEFSNEGYLRLIRQDISVGNSFYTKTVRNGQCYDETGGSGSPDWTTEFLYDSASYPKDVKCPNGSNGCKSYCFDSSDYDCITLDAAGRLVTDGYVVWTYFDAPAMSEFEGDKCKDEHLPAPPDFCATRKLLNPKYYDGCTFHLTFHEVDDRRRDVEQYDIYGLVVDDKFVALKIESGEYYTVVRLDVLNDEGKFYIREHEPKRPCTEYYEDQDFLREISEMLPEPFWYEGANYPVPTECPDGSDGCNKYCVFPKMCIVVDAAGRIIEDRYGNWTYNPAPSVDMFAIDTCKGEHIPAPNGCNGGQSSTPNPPEPPKPSTSATSAPISSASIVKSAFTFVAILIVVALL